MKAYRCYLFDADGTLIDTAELIYRCFEHSLGKFAKRKVGRDEIQSNIGLPLRKAMEQYLGPLDDERFAQVRDVHMRYQLAIYPRYLKPFAGVQEGIGHLKEMGKQVGVVSSRLRDTLTLYLQVAGLLDCMDIIVTPEDTARHKPEPEPLLEALKRCRVRREHAVYIGDASFDIECGAAAGVDTVFVGWSRNDPAGFSVKPTHTIATMDELTGHAHRGEDE